MGPYHPPMQESEALIATQLDLPNRRQGKVRDVYDCTARIAGREQPAILLVATDRISAYDVVMPTPIPVKGRLLTAISGFWFDLLTKRLPEVKHHLLSLDPTDVVGLQDEQRAGLRGRVMIGRRTRVVPIECVVRGYLAGSGWKAYQQTGEVCGVPLPPGLKQCEKLPQPIFTPATKAAPGEGHDENIAFDEACDRVGGDLMRTLRDRSLAIYQMAAAHAEARGILLADTKFEFGLPLDAADHADAQPLLIDEALTPDSSRFWPAHGYQPGRDQPSFDKQYVRNHLETLVAAGAWDKTPPGPPLPPDVIAGTLTRYHEAHQRLTAPHPA